MGDSCDRILGTRRDGIPVAECPGMKPFKTIDKADLANTTGGGLWTSLFGTGVNYGSTSQTRMDRLRRIDLLGGPMPWQAGGPAGW